MSLLTYTITQEVFDLFPEYVRGVVFATGVKNGESSPELASLLRAAEASVREQLTPATITTHPRLAAWREAFRKQGIKTSEYRPSVEAMTRRALRGQELPSINRLVDIGNILSLRHLVPTGGHSINGVTQDLALRRASGEEDFVPFGSDQVEHPAPGEIVFVEGQTVLTRRWIWRQANRTLTLPATTAIEFNIDGLPPVSQAEVAKIAAELMALIQQYCGGQSYYEALWRGQPQIPIPPVG
jgi:DNA/RNA-binding domain of Phe-tRNA-synthetase-like protein